MNNARVCDKNHRLPASFKAILFLLLIFCISLLFGCAKPKITVNPDMKVENYKDYKLVYLLAPDTKEKDPRNIFPKVVERLERLGFQVQAVNKENPIKGSQGTGFVIDPKGYVLTCAHLFKKEGKATLWIKGKRYEADVIKKNEDKDLALLKIKENKKLNLQSLPIPQDIVYKMGQDVFTIGFPLSDILGNSPRLNKGLISSTVGLKDDPDHLQISAAIQPGNSGSPLLNDNGVVIGMIQSTLNPISVFARTGGSLPQNVNFAAKTNVIREFIRSSSSDINVVQDSEKRMDFDQVSNSVAQIRAGIVTEEFLKQPKMICRVLYQSFWDIWYRFRFFHMEFYDLETGKLLFKAGQYRSDPLSTETKVLDETFEQIQERFQL